MTKHQKIDALPFIDRRSFIVGTAAGQRNLAAGIGYYGAARAVYYRWIAHGQKIDFVKNTRIVVETTPRRSAPIKP